MQSNYLNNKENSYRQGVLEGNYVEEIYARDFDRSKRKEPRIFVSETKEKFNSTLNRHESQSQNDKSGTLNCDEAQPLPTTTVDSITKRAVCEEDENDYNGFASNPKKEQTESGIKDSNNKTNEINPNPDINYLQSYKRLVEPDNDGGAHGHSAKKINSDKKSKKNDLSTHLFLNHGLETEKPANEEFLTTYNISYDKKIKPQDIVPNNVRATNLLSKVKLNDTIEKTGPNSTTNSQTDNVKNYARKNQEFTRTFDKSHANVGFRH